MRVGWAVLFVVGLGFAPGAHAAAIRTLCEIQGAQGNVLKGIGIVVGLAGTGDNNAAAIRHQDSLLSRLSIEVSSEKDLVSDNIATVIVTATLPAFAKQGTRIDVHVASLYDAKSLEGGTLLDTLLEGIDGNVYAVAQGSISVGGFNADAGGGTRVRKNHVTAGRIPMGGMVEREVPSTITDGERLMLLLKRPDFITANNIQQAIDAEFGPGTAMAFGAGSINVKIPPAHRENLVTFIAQLQAMDVQSHLPATVVVNERTGTIVVGGDVLIRPCQVAHGGITIKVAVTPHVTPALPFSDSVPVVTETQTLEIVTEEARFMPVEGVTAAEIAERLNRFKVTPRDMIAIFQAIREAGAMDADLEIM
jgi:flagellar P-ring protein FlgI